VIKIIKNNKKEKTRAASVEGRWFRDDRSHGAGNDEAKQGARDPFSPGSICVKDGLLWCDACKTSVSAELRHAPQWGTGCGCVMEEVAAVAGQGGHPRRVKGLKVVDHAFISKLIEELPLLQGEMRAIVALLTPMARDDQPGQLWEWWWVQRATANVALRAGSNLHFVRC